MEIRFVRGRLRRAFVALLAGSLSIWSSASRAEIDLGAPLAGPPTPGSIPALPVSGTLLEPPPALTGSLWVHEGRMSSLGDTSLAPGLSSACSDLIPAPAATTVSPALAGHLSSALAEADASTSQLDGGTILAAFQLFEDLIELTGGDVEVAVGPTQERCVSYRPVHARWLRRQWGLPGVFASPLKGETLYEYHPQPRPFREIRERGARLYCAARSAQLAQGGKVASMGERVGFSATVLKKKIDFLVVEPTLVFDGAERFTGMGANDGAQAFEIPLLFGVRITPIRGLGLPGFREVRVPVSLVSADSEIRTGANLRPVLLGSSIQCSFSGGPPFVCKLVPNFSTQHSKEYQTVTHLDLIRSAGREASLTGESEVFRVGPLAVVLGFELGYAMGSLGVDNSRVLELPASFGTPPARSGRLWTHLRRFQDGPWQPRFEAPSFSAPPGSIFWVALPDGLTDVFWTEQANLFFPPPLDVRLFHDDDHALESATGLDITGSLGGELGKDFGPFELTLKVTGSLTGSVSQRHVLRDALLAQDQGAARMTPTTAVSVRPRQTAQATLQPAKGTLRLYLDLGIPFVDPIDITKTLFQVNKVDLAAYDSDDDLAPLDEVWNLRLASGSSQGNVTGKPVAYSHLPGSSAEFASFATDVETCLADPAENPPTPPPCEPTQDDGGPPAAEICAFGPTAQLRPVLGLLPANVCAQIGSYVAAQGLAPAQQECVIAYLDFLCSPVSKQQPWSGPPSVVAHVLDLDDALQGQALADMLAQCIQAFGAPGSAGNLDSNAVAESFLEFGLCDATGALFGPGEILGAAGNPTDAPDPVLGPACN